MFSLEKRKLSLQLLILSTISTIDTPSLRKGHKKPANGFSVPRLTRYDLTAEISR